MTESLNPKIARPFDLTVTLAALVIYLAEYLHDLKDKLTYKQ